MGMAANVLRISLNTFFNNYHCFTSIAILLVFPVSAATLLSQSPLPSSSPALRSVVTRLRSLFNAAGLPPSPFFSLAALKIAQTALTAAFTLPFSLSFHLFAKATAITLLHAPRRRRFTLPPLAKAIPLYPPLLLTQAFAAVAVIAVNAAALAILSAAFNAAVSLGVACHAVILAISAAGVVAYSVAISTTTVTCNLAVTLAAVEGCDGHHAVLRAASLIRGRLPAALALAVATNLAIAATEALFQLRVVGPSQHEEAASAGPDPVLLSEAFLIAYIHALLVTVEIVVGFVFYKSCKLTERSEGNHGDDEVEGDDYGDKKFKEMRKV